MKRLYCLQIARSSFMFCSRVDPLCVLSKHLFVAFCCAIQTRSFLVLLKGGGSLWPVWNLKWSVAVGYPFQSGNTSMVSCFVLEVYILGWFTFAWMEVGRLLMLSHPWMSREQRVKREEKEGSVGQAGLQPCSNVWAVCVQADVPS